MRKLDKPCTSCSTGGKHWGHGFLLQTVKEVQIYRRGMFGGREGEDQNNSGSKIVKYQLISISEYLLDNIVL